MGLAERVAAAPSTRKMQKVDTPEWADLLEGEDVYARSLNAIQRAAFLDGATVSTDGQTASINLGVLVPHVTDLAVDKDGKPLFEIGHRDMLCNDHPDVVSRVLSVAVELTEFDSETAKN
jgi:hypothetical protein